MNKFSIFVIAIIIFGGVQMANAQNGNLNMELEVTDEEKIIIFSGFSIAVIGLFLSRHLKNIILIGVMIMKNLDIEVIQKKTKSSEKP
jgi:hypothetical protein